MNQINEYIVFSVADDEYEEDPGVAPDKTELASTLRTLSAKLDDLSTCHELITKHGAGLQRALSDIEQCDSPQDLAPTSPQAAARLKSLNERATLFRITSNAMINVSKCLEGIKLFIVAVTLGVIKQIW